MDFHQGRAFKNEINLKKIELKPNGFYIDGKPRILRGSSFQWFKLPKETWEDRISRLKGAGYNAIDLYVAWKNHEPKEGEFDFKTFDLKYLLELAKKHDMMAMIRPGPYICNEMDGGGIPAWIMAKSSKEVLDGSKKDGKLILRTNDVDYLDYVDRYLKKVNEVVKPYLHTNGGPIVLYSIENEYNWYILFSEIEKAATKNGRAERPYNQVPDVKAYFEKLRDVAKSSGIDVPITTCPGTSRIEGMGDVKGVVPMPNIYVGMDSLEYQGRSLIKEMHSNQHSGIYKNYPAGITETLREANYLRRLILCGMDAVFQFNNVGFIQEGRQNTVIPDSTPIGDIKGFVEGFGKKMISISPEHARTGFVRPPISFFPGVGDYEGAAIGPSGSLRDNYYNIRRTNLFINSFEKHIAEGGISARSSWNQSIRDQDDRVIVKSDKVGIKDPDMKEGLCNYWLPLKDNSALIGINNNGQGDIDIGKNSVRAFGEDFPKYSSLTVPTEEGLVISSSSKDENREYTMLLPYNFPLDDGLKLKYSTSEVLSFSKMGQKEKLLVVYGKSGSEGELKIEGTNLKINQASKDIVLNEKCNDSFTVSYKHGDAQSLSFENQKGEKYKLIILDRKVAGKTWFINTNAGRAFIAGVDYLEHKDRGSLIHIYNNRESLLGRDNIITYSPKPFRVSGLEKMGEFDKDTGITKYQLPYVVFRPHLNINLSMGRAKSENLPLGEDVKESEGWISIGDKPMELEKLGIFAGHAWYKGEFNLSGNKMEDKGLWIEHASDFQGIYINGHYLTTLVPIGTEIDSNSKDLNYKFKIPDNILKTGKNSITFRSEIWGHGSLMFPSGNINRLNIPIVGGVKIPFIKIRIPGLGYDALKGLSGEAKVGDSPIVNWKVKGGLEGEEKGYFSPDFLDYKFEKKSVPFSLKPGEILWYRTSFDSNDLPKSNDWFAPLSMQLKGENTKASIYLNGRLVGRWLSDEKWLQRGGWFKPSKNMWSAYPKDSFPIPSEVLKRGRNLISIAFEDTSDSTKNEAPGKVLDINIDISREYMKRTESGIENVPALYKKIEIDAT